ncbi:MAG: hypothetical protein IPP58_00650 [Holophagaceae bacterium]|uniref:S1/P1 Nuclease n=1 Tax=Candidatus Geothrix skivensis TaxID=2954439 RepID=A0A9D7XJY2_9BACT|nr:hypothetical protein [Candidatus Geothrix skivensis]
MRVEVCLLLLLNFPLLGWGPKGHRLAAEGSLRTLPPTLRAWFLEREDEYTRATLEPDLWKQRDPDEAERHRIFCEAYGGAGRVPLQEATARAEVSPWTFASSGQLPWVIAERYQRLVQAFRAGGPEGVVAASGWLGHYIADGQVPLHTTRNRNGKLTAQKGVHQRWEMDLLGSGPERLRDLRGAVAPGDVPKAIAGWILDSHALVEPLLKADRATRDASVGGGKGALTPWVDQKAVALRQLQRSAEYTGDLLLAAWMEAGQPSRR